MGGRFAADTAKARWVPWEMICTTASALLPVVGGTRLIWASTCGAGVVLDAVPEVADTQPDASSVIERKEVGNLLELAMQRLPEQQRVAVILSYHENMSNGEIAEVMKLVLSSVRPTGSGKEGARSSARYALDDDVVEQASGRVRRLLDRFPLYPELDLDLMLETVPIGN